jgi:hypothetical protein
MSLKNFLLKSQNNLTAFFYQSVNTDYLSFFRIAISLIAIFEIFSIHSDLDTFFSKNKAIIPQDLNYLFTEYFEYLKPIYNFLRTSNLIDFFYSNIIYLYIIVLLFLLFGFFTRLSAILAIILQLIIFKSFVMYNYGYDHFLTGSFFYCLIFPVNRVKSIDSLIFKKKININFNYKKVLRIHLSIIYFFSGIAKIISLTWWNGEAIWRSISTIYDNYFKVPPIILCIVGILTFTLETFYPILILYTKTRKATLITTITMHLAIAVILQLPFFALLMIVWNITAYYEYFNFNSKK